MFAPSLERVIRQAYRFQAPLSSKAFAPAHATLPDSVGMAFRIAMGLNVNLFFESATRTLIAGVPHFLLVSDGDGVNWKNKR